MMSRKLQIKILGSLQVKVGEETAVFRTDALRVLLSTLAAHQGQPQRRDTLAGLLSPDRPNKEALTYLRNRLTRLRKTIGDDTASPPYLAIDRKQITLRTGDDISVDVVQFEQCLATVETHPHRQLAGCPTCLGLLETAVSLIRGELLAGLNFPSETWEAWLTAQRGHIHQRALEAMSLLRDARMQLGEWTAVLDIAQRQLQLEPWLEPTHRALMQAHALLGDRNAALAQFEQCQTVLWDELGIEPEEETITLWESIQAGELDLSLIIPNSSLPNNLPLPPGQFFGREAEQTQLLQRLVDPNYRLITLVGTAGIGKTRLAIEVGRQVKTSFPDGVWFVPLEAVQEGAEQIKIAVGEAVDLAQDDKQLTGEQVLAILRDKQMLLIFDNSEVTLDNLVFIPEWLRRAPNIAILATSREPLNFQAESVIFLDGLPIGEVDMSAAEAMFAERGQTARADFAVTAVNLPQVRHICELVGGSPLGIALAAAWVRRRSLPQIIEGIGQSLDFLSTRLRDVDPRHRSVRAVFETSWQLLSAEEQAVLATLSVFPETFTAVSAAKVSGATLLDLDLLCEKSLLQQQHEPERYEMHSLLRQFATDKLANRKPKVNRAFVDHFYQFASDHRDDYAALQPEWRNFSAGIAKAHTLAAWQTILDFVQVLDEPWFRQIRFQDMREGLALALEAATLLQNQPALAWTLLRLGEIETELNDYATAEAHLAEGLQLFMRLEDSLGIAQGRYLYGRINMEQAKDNQAIELCTNSMHIFEEQEDWLGVAKNLNLLALCHIKKHRDFQTAQAFLEKSVTLQQTMPPTSNYIETLRHLARVKSVMKEFDAAEDYLSEAAHIAHQHKNVGEYAATLYERVILCKKQGQHHEALKFGYESLDNLKKLGSLRLEAMLKTQLGLLHQAEQNFEQAMDLLKDGLQIFSELGDIFEQAHSHFYLHKLHAAVNNTKQSQNAWQQAYNLNLKLKDPRLTERLNESASPH
ncbi:BTAD domain-containing putative transcriptional regulator [Candidatus Leptofilum sp.]|uniref:BTAD domain-containing putative transcriptional regulator n=1 Tax=Candidatus Leptofilum sp. TaxID=3241576 RepID=UPI003B5AC836